MFLFFFVECKFNIQKYKDGSSRDERGLAVILYVFKDGEKMVVCCNEKHEIIPEKMVSGNMDFSVEIYSNKTSSLYSTGPFSVCVGFGGK